VPPGSQCVPHVVVVYCNAFAVAGGAAGGSDDVAAIDDDVSAGAAGSTSTPPKVRPWKQKAPEPVHPSSVIMQFRSVTGEDTGPQIEVPFGTTRDQLEQILNSVLSSDEKKPFSFYISETEIMDSLGSTMLAQVHLFLLPVNRPACVVRVSPPVGVVARARPRKLWCLLYTNH
jgi:hypothetical protein